MNRNLLRTLRKSGVKSIKSQYLSWKHTGKMNKIILGKRTKSNISKKSKIKIGERFKFGFGSSEASKPDYSKIEILPEATLHVEDLASIKESSALHLEGKLKIGNSFVNAHSRIMCEDKITIGNNCAIS